MQNKSDYLLRIKGIEEGSHQVGFNLKQSLLEAIDHRALKNAQFDCLIDYDKKGDLITLDFTFEGLVNNACDRCTVDIAIPVKESYRMWASYQSRDDSDETRDILDQEDWIFLNEKQDYIDLKQYLIDFLVLSLPTKFQYDCREDKPYPCDEEVLSKIGYFEVEKEKESKSSIWEDLKDIKWD